MGIAPVLALAACSGPNFAGLSTEPRRAALTERVITKTLANGLRVVLLPETRTNLVKIGVHYSVGGADDPDGEDGLAHYVEHVMFNAAYDGQGGASLREVGLDMNAFTSYDRTFFYLTSLESELDRSLEIAARRFETRCDDLDGVTLARERDVVVEEHKQRNDPPVAAAILKAVWGTDHPYGRDPGGIGFADVSQPELCKFIDEHYGPGSAVLVVTGNVGSAELDRIRDRFEKIPPRSAPGRLVRIKPIQTLRLVVRDLARPTALVVIPAPREGTAADAAVALLDGQSWPLFGAGGRIATTIVVGEERERAIVAIAEIDDAKGLEQLASDMQRALEHSDQWGFEIMKQRLRARVAARLDDTFAADVDIAATVARGERPSRFRNLRQVDELTAEQVMKLLDTPKIRLAYLLPEVGVTGTKHATEVATSLHQLEVVRAPATTTEPLPLPSARRAMAVTDYRLANGLRVVLAPDPDAVALDARVVVAGTQDEHASKLDEIAAMFLTPDRDWSTSRNGLWYRRLVGAPVVGYSGQKTTAFGIRGLALFGDWHVWNLAATVVHGTYSSSAVDYGREAEKRSLAKRKRKRKVVPSSLAIVERRLAGATGVPGDLRMVHSAKALDAFRRSRYRPDTSTLIVSGKFDIEPMRKEIESLFGEWTRPSAPVVSTTVSPRVTDAVAIIDDDLRTVEVTLAFAPASAPAASEAAARAVLDEMLGARMRVVRESLGASYGVNAAASTTAFWVHGEVEPAYAGEAAKAMAGELERLRTGDATLVDDFVRARKKVLANALAVPVSASRRADALERIVAGGGDVKDLDREVEAIRTLDFAAVRKLAARDLRPDRMIVAARGSRDAVEAALVGLGVAKATIEWVESATRKRDQKPAEAPRWGALQIK